MTRLPIVLVACFSVFLKAPAPGHAQDGKKPYKVITAPEVKAMLDEERALVVHVLSEIEYNIQHIGGDINIPITDMPTTEKLPRDKDKPLVFYCMGER